MYFPKTHHFDVGLEKGISSERLVGKKSLTLALYRRLKQKTDAWQRWPAKTFSKFWCGRTRHERSLALARAPRSYDRASRSLSRLYVAGGIFCRGII